MRYLTLLFLFGFVYGQDSTYTWRKATALEIAQGKDSPENSGMILVAKKVKVETAEEVQNKKLFNTIKQTAQSAVGIKYDALSITQVRALYGFVLFKEGAIDTSGKIRPLKDWVK